MELWLTEPADQGLISSETAFLKDILNHLDIAVFCVDVIDDDTFIFSGFNQAHEKLSKLVSKDLIGKQPKDLDMLPEDIRIAIKQNYLRCLASENGIEYHETIEVEGTTTHWLTRLVPVKKSTGEVYRIIGSSSPIGEVIRKTEQLNEAKEILEKTVRQREKELAESEERYQLATEASNQGIWDWKVPQNEVWYSKTWKAQVGYAEDELANDFKTWQDLLHPDDYDRCKKAVIHYVNNPVGQFQLDFRFRHKLGHYVRIHNESSAKVDESGQVLRMYGAHTDVTEKFEQNLLLEEANQSKERLISILAHDLKTPFNAILGFLDILNSDFDQISDDAKKTYINKLFDSASRTYELLENVLHWSKIRQGKFKPVPVRLRLKKLIDRCVIVLQSAINGKDLRLINHLSEECRLVADSDMVELIIRNLISNAIKFSKRGGQIDISCTHFKNGLQVTVADNGVGIQPQHLEKIFDPGAGFTTPGTEAEKGTGLGLILCKEFVELHNGKLTIDSTPGQGTRVSVFVPD